MRDQFAHTLAQLASQDERVFFITADLGFSVFEEFAERYPHQYLNIGVAEQNMIAVATGMALDGRIVFVYSIGNFPVLRCLEQIRNDAAYHEANVNIVSIGAGFSYGSLGFSHHATEDLAIMRAIPNVCVMTPGTLDDVTNSTVHLSGSPGTGYLRLDRSYAEETPDAEPFRAGRWRIMRSGTHVAIIATGGVGQEALVAASHLAERGIDAQVVNATQLSALPQEEIERTIGGAPIAISVEEHVTRGGLAGLVSEAIAQRGIPCRLTPCGISEGFTTTVGSQAFLRMQVGVDSASIVDVVERALR